MSKRQELEAKIVAKAAQDSRFRAALLQNPKQAIAAELGVELPASLELVVVEETATRKYLVLPGAELSDADLVSKTAMGYVGRVSGFVAHKQ
jgi:hypothetical protein